MPTGPRRFPATVVLFQHGDDLYLFDTGYSARIFEFGWRSRVYNHLNPVFFNAGDDLMSQLSCDGIEPGDITGIIISHLHPDHIGGLCDFPGCWIFTSQEVFRTFKNPGLRDLVFMNMVPRDFSERCVALNIRDEYDLFADGSVILLNLSGHTNGQIGMLLPEHNVLFAADSCWGSDLFDKPMKLLGRCLQKNYADYQNSITRIRRLQKTGVDVICCHGDGLRCK